MFKAKGLSRVMLPKQGLVTNNSVVGWPGLARQLGSGLDPCYMSPHHSLNDQSVDLSEFRNTAYRS
jgi:hypothetical protein